MVLIKTEKKRKQWKIPWPLWTRFYLCRCTVYSNSGLGRTSSGLLQSARHCQLYLSAIFKRDSSETHEKRKHFGLQSYICRVVVPKMLKSGEIYTMQSEIWTLFGGSGWRCGIIFICKSQIISVDVLQQFMSFRSGCSGQLYLLHLWVHKCICNVWPFHNWLVLWDKHCHICK